MRSRTNGVIPDYNFRVAGVKILRIESRATEPLSHLMTLKIAVSNQIFSLQSRTVLITRIKMVLLSTSATIIKITDNVHFPGYKPETVRFP